jgi:hypothetical protein
MTHSSDRHPEPCPESSNAVGKMLKKFQHDQKTVRFWALTTDDGDREKM